LERSKLNSLIGEEGRKLSIKNKVRQNNMQTKGFVIHSKDGKKSRSQNTRSNNLSKNITREQKKRLR